METIGAQVAPDANEEQNEMPANGSIEIGQQDPVPAGNQPVVNDLEARRQLIRLELVRWRRQFVRGNNPSNVRKTTISYDRSNFNNSMILICSDIHHDRFHYVIITQKTLPFDVSRTAIWFIHDWH